MWPLDARDYFSKLQTLDISAGTLKLGEGACAYPVQHASHLAEGAQCLPEGLEAILLLRGAPWPVEISPHLRAASCKLSQAEKGESFRVADNESQAGNPRSHVEGIGFSILELESA